MEPGAAKATGGRGARSGFQEGPSAMWTSVSGLRQASVTYSLTCPSNLP